MTIELTMLALSIVLGLVQIVLCAHSKALVTGYAWAGGSRDGPRPTLTPIAGRLERALSNFLETFPLFAAAVLIAHAAGQHDWMTVWGAQLYFWGRVVYCRSTSWACSCCARCVGTCRRSGSFSSCCR